MNADIPKQVDNDLYLQQIIAGLTEGIILIKPDQTLCWANQAAMTMHGVQQLDELGTTVEAYRSKFKLTYSNKHPLPKRDYPIERVLAGEIFDQVVVEVMHANRPGPYWIHQIRSLILARVPQTPELFVLIMEDVTERFDAEERFERTFNANPAPAIICRLADLRYVKVNRGFLEMTGFSSHDTIGRSVYDLDVLAAAERREQAVICLREGRTIEQQEACISIAGGRSKYVMVAGQPIELAEQGCMLFTFIDLEPRKKIEDALRQSEERFAKAFKLAPVSMAVSSLDDQLFLDVNDAFVAMTGYSHTELLGRSTAEIELWESLSARRNLHQQFQKAGTIRNYEIKLRTKAGVLLDCLVSAERVTILGQPCVLDVVQDMTARRQSETELFSAIETVMQDTSWFTQKVIEKVADLRQPSGATGIAAGLEDLTDREQEVLGMMCTGAADTEIAQQLKVSRHTIRNHVSAIYEKIGVHRRSAAIVWARDRNLTGRIKQRGARPKKLRRER